MAGVGAPPVDPTHLDGPWYKLLTRYHWFVFAVAALGWLFDTMDQQLFVLARDEAVADLLKISPTDPQLAKFGGNATMIFLFGWAAGGLGFGIMGDRVGRVKTMLATILLYSIFTGLSVFATGYYDFMAYRFLTGLGVGGEFAVGVALVAEVMPDRARPYALSWLQALSAIGNCTAAGIYILLGHLQAQGSLDGLTLPGGTPFTAWRIAFSIGTLPALLAIFVRRKLKEPERWQAADAKHQKRGSYSELFGNPILRRNAFIGLAIGFAGVVGLWGIGFFSVQLQKSVFRELFTKEGMTGIALEGAIKKWSGYTSLMLNVGAVLRHDSLGSGRPAARSTQSVCDRLHARHVQHGRGVRVFRQPAARLHAHSVDGRLLTLDLRLLGDLLPRVVPHAVAQHRHVVLLQRRTICGGGRAVYVRLPHEQRVCELQGSSPELADAIRRRINVRDLPAGPGRAAVRPGNQRQTAAGITRPRRRRLAKAPCAHSRPPAIFAGGFYCAVTRRGRYTVRTSTASMPARRAASKPRSASS
ncbi:MAG: MFS transporter [Pirellulales bacterium]